MANRDPIEYRQRPDTQSSFSSTAPVPPHADCMLYTHCSYLLPTLDSLLACKPSLQLLDVGCGSGRLTTDLAQHLSSRSSADANTNSSKGPCVTGLDISPAILASAKQHALARGFGGEQVQFVTGSAAALPFAANSFDAAHAHQVLSHVADPVSAVRELLRVVRPGGAVLLREGDLTSAAAGPAGAERARTLAQFFALLARVQAAEGGSAEGGKRLRGWVREAGAPDAWVAENGNSCARYETRESRREYAVYWPARCMGGMFAEKAMEAGAGRETLEQYARSWKGWMEDNDAWLTMVHGEVVVKVPDSLS